MVRKLDILWSKNWTFFSQILWSKNWTFFGQLLIVMVKKLDVFWLG